MVSVTSLDRKYHSLETKLRRVANRALRQLKEEEGDADVYLVSDTAMRKLNRKFRGRDSRTTVLSFTEPGRFPHPERKNSYLGEIYLAPDFIRVSGSRPEALLVHGLLHLLGYTHGTRNDRIKMEKLERKLCDG